ncbi:MAG: alpha/beta hydrolase [Thermoleophilia bacterium]|nr:alpha/beta hydrolase [Thermoleophilia bacterium]
MPLHPLAKAFIEQYIASGGRPVCSMSVEEARRTSTEMFAMAPPGPPVTRVEDMRIPGPGNDIPIRVYAPEGVGPLPGVGPLSGVGPLPVLVYFHGGGWVVGDVEAQDADCRTMANGAGCIVVSVDYCLAPENKFPAPAEDAYAATQWVAENAARLGGDGTRIAVGGGSAGGNLAAVVALMARDRGGPPLACQVLTVPVTDRDFDTESYRENGEDYVLTRDEMMWFWDHYLNSDDEAGHPYASPLRAPDLSGLPSAFVQTAEYDPLRDDGRAYADRLKAVGVPVKYRCYEGMIHMALGPEAMDDVTCYLKEHLS